MTAENFKQGFRQYLKDECRVQRSDRLLLAVSGGVDSMVMCWAFQHFGFDFTIAHANFGLRGKESDLDQAFVATTALAYGKPFFAQRFDTSIQAEQSGISIQMAARELRYSWFETLRISEQLEYIALAHHLGDLGETLMINLVRGTSIGGLHGILPIKDRLVRPLLFLGKADLLALASELQIPFREDSSNMSHHYVRNRILLEVMPTLRAINPSLDQTLGQTAVRLASVERLYRKYLAELRASLVEVRQSGLYLNISGLRALGPDLPFVLYEFLQEYGFSQSMGLEVAASLEGKPGKLWMMPGYSLLLDRQFLVLEPIDSAKPTTSFDQLFTIEYLSPPVPTSNSPHTAYLDAALLSLPLELNYWKPGDWFIPLGMQQKKKLQDFFTDLKIPKTQKSKIPLVYSGEHIVWVAGLRIDDRFKVGPKAQRILKLTYLASEELGAGIKGNN